MAENVITNTWSRVKYVLGLCLLFLITIKISYFIQLILYYVFDVSLDGLLFKITVIVMQIAIFVAVIAVGLKDQKKTILSVCFFKKVNGFVWGAAILCSIGYTLFSFYLHSLFFSFKYGWNTNYAPEEVDFLFDVIDTAIIPAVAEEILFKGVIFSILKKFYPTVAAAVIASIMFSACHLSFIRFIPLFLLSCYTFWLYLRSGSLLLPMLLHFVNNLFSFVLISEPFSSVWTFYSALILLATGSYMLYELSKKETKP